MAVTPAVPRDASRKEWRWFPVVVVTLLIVTSLCFLVTQREMFNATIASLTTLMAALPVLTRVVGLLAGRRDLELPKA